MKYIKALLLSGVIVALSAVRVTAETGEQAAVWISDWRDQTFQDSKKPQQVPDSINLTMAKNDTEPFQINVRSGQNGQIHCVAFSNLVSGDHVISAENLSYSYVEFIRPYNNSRYSDSDDKDAKKDEWGTWWVNISNPLRKISDKETVAFPEILSNTQSKAVKSGNTQPIWIKVYIPEGAQPGLYLGVVQVQTTFGDFTFDLNVDVKNVTIPKSQSGEAFSMEIWSQLIGNFDTAVDVIEAAYDVKVDTPEWWHIMGSFADLMRENRLNVLTVNQTDLLLRGPNTQVSEDGVVTFDWSFFNRFVTFFRERGGIQEFSGGPLAKYKANPQNYNNDKPGEEVNDYTTVYVECIVRDPETGKAVKRLLPADLEAYEAGQPTEALTYLDQYAAALNGNLKSQGLSGIFGHHIIDEPGKRQQAALYPVLEQILTNRCPGIVTGDAFTVWTAEEQAAHTERFAIMEYSLDELTDMMKSTLKEGDELWVYTSCVPLKDNYLNRTMDQPVWFMEMLGWFCYKHDATGYLHWGLNQWNTWTTDYLPFPDYPQSMMYDNTLGDASCVYPDKENFLVKSSIRVEALRECSELYSLIRKAEEKDAAQVQEILNQMLRSGRDYETDTKKIGDARIRILELASQ